MTNQADIDVKIDCQPVRGVPPLSGAATTGESEQAAERSIRFSQFKSRWSWDSKISRFSFTRA